MSKRKMARRIRQLEQRVTALQMELAAMQDERHNWRDHIQAALNGEPCAGQGPLAGCQPDSIFYTNAEGQPATYHVTYNFTGQDQAR